MNPGNLRHRITLQTLNKTEDGTGGYLENWSDVVTVWAQVQPLNGTERYNWSQISNDIAYRVTIRYRPNITPDMRVKYGNKIFQIESIIDVDERHTELQLLCSEVVQ